MRKTMILTLILSVLCAACVKEYDAPEGISSFAVLIEEGETGDDNDRIAFPDEPVGYRLTIAALDETGEVDRDYDGKVVLSVEPVGRLMEGQASRLIIENGVAQNVEVWLESTHGDVAVWVEDAGGLDVEGSRAVGASPVLYFDHPTIAQTQRCDDFESSALRGDFAEIKVAERDVVVTNVRRDGFYCQDLAEPGGQYGGMYVYTHNQPTGLEEGMTLTTLRGQVDEFFGFTELGFPDYQFSTVKIEMPDPVVLTAQMTANDDGMEALESSLVRVEDVVVCPMDDQYTAYDQWRVLLNPDGDCDEPADTILVSETAGIEGVDPPSMVGDELDAVTGTLRYHYLAEPSWMIVPRRAADLE